MKYLKGTIQFINEANVNISYDIDDNGESIIQDWDQEVEDWVQSIEGDLGLKSGKLYFDGRKFEVEGTDSNGDYIEIKQKGEYNMYGGPYDPKMEIPIFTINGIDVYPIVRADMKEGGYVEDNNEVDMVRTDMLNFKKIDAFINLTDDEKSNMRTSFTKVRKFDL